MQHREMVESRYKYDKSENTKDQRPKYIHKPRVESRPMERHIPVPKSNMIHKPHSVETRPKLRPTMVPRGTEMKPITTLNKTKLKVETKVSPKTNEHIEKSTKNAEEFRQDAVQGSPSDETTHETSAPGGYYELSPLMSRMLDTELQDIMIKVWQELPDNPTSEAEKLVVNKLRNKAGDDLRSVFGLNVSQRLLNVFNILYIKMKFTTNPEGQELTKFLVKNNITNFKWNNVKPLTYNAVVKNVKDFDRLCATQSYTVGNVKVNITPLYQFTKCPLKLRTSYHIDNTTSKGVIKEEVKDKTNPTSEVIEATSTESPTKIIEPQPVDVKPIQNKVSDNPPVAVKELAKPEIISKEKTKEIAKVDTFWNENKKVKKPIIKKVEKKVFKKEPVDKKPKTICKNILQDGNDFDELNDDEIMVLVSQGIVLDQCSGSDED